MAKCEKKGVENLSDMLRKYADYLLEAAKKVNENHNSLFTVRSLDETEILMIIYPQYIVKPTFASRYKALVDHIYHIQKNLYL